MLGVNLYIVQGGEAGARVKERSATAARLLGKLPADPTAVGDAAAPGGDLRRGTLCRCGS